MKLTKSSVLLSTAGLFVAVGIAGTPGALAHHKGGHTDRGSGNDPEIVGPPAADETGCRDVTKGKIDWKRPGSLRLTRQGVDTGLVYVPTGRPSLAFTAFLADTSCADVTYHFTVYNQNATVLETISVNGDGASNEVTISRSYDPAVTTRCVAVDVKTTSVIDGYTVTHDVAPNVRESYRDACDDGPLQPGTPGQVWN